MFYAKFDIDGIRKIYEHSVKNPVFQPTFSQLFDGKYRKDGKTIEPGEGTWPKADDVDVNKLPRQAFAVKDSGFYIMAATEKTLPGENTKNFVVYCEGINPDEDPDYYEQSRRLLGGDDFAEAISLDWLERAIKHAERTGDRFMTIRVTSESFELILGPSE